MNNKTSGNEFVIPNGGVPRRGEYGATLLEIEQDEQWRVKLTDLLNMPDYKINTPDRLEWYLWQRRLLYQDIVSMEKQAADHNAAAEKLLMRAKRRREDFDKFLYQFDQQAAALVLSLNKQDKIPGKTRVMNNGTVSVRKSGERVKMDKTAVMNWIYSSEKRKATFVRQQQVIEEVIDFDAVKALGERTRRMVPGPNGEVWYEYDIPGLEFKPERENLTVKGLEVDEETKTS